MGLQDILDSVRSRIGNVEGAVPPDEGSSDPKCSSYGRDMSFRNPDTRIYYGRITDSCPALNAFRVAVPNAGVRVCTPLLQTGGSLCAQAGYAPGDEVILVCVGASQNGVILGKIQPGAAYGGYDLRSFISMSDCFTPDAFQKSVFETLSGKENTDMPSWIPNTPINRTDAGEFFVGSPAGPKLFADPFMASLSLNDATGVWVFRDDSLLRLAGLNYQHLTSGSWETRLNDNGEYSEVSGHCLNAGEAFGYYEKPEKILERNDSWTDAKEPASFMEPTERTAKPFYRVQEFKGWLGQGKQSHIVAPPDSGTVSKYGEKAENQHGLSRIVQLADGFVGIESVKGISITKRSVLPAVQQMELPEDNKYGDTSENYDFEHADFKVSGEPDFHVSDTNKLMQSVMAVEDYRAYVSNYKTVAAFAHHVKDWFVPEESALEKGSFSLKDALGTLKGKQLLDVPEPYTLTLDGTEQKYYPVEAGLHFLPDGGVVLHDGYGSELRMSGGQITLSAPGGIWLKSGKDIQLWSGHDLNLRTKGCVDITAAEGSVRMKAEKNLELLGGNEEGESGVVIESKGRGGVDFSAGGDKIKTGGIVIRAANGMVSTMADAVYTRAGVDGTGKGILLDAGRGSLCTVSREKVDYVSARHAVVFGDFESRRVEAVQESLKNRFTTPGGFTCGGDAAVLGTAQVEQSVRCGGHFYSKGAQSNPEVTPIVKKDAAAFDRYFRETQTYVDTASVENHTTRLKETVVPAFYDENKPGSERALRESEFSFRTDEELNLTDFHVYADRWQTLCTVGVPWEERPVTTSTGKGEYPFPGKKYFKETPCYVTQEFALCEDGEAADRGSDYSKPKYKEPQIRPLDEYTTIS